MKGPLVALLLIVLLVVAQAICYYPRLPDPMASHFGGGGVPDGWSSRTAFFAVYVAALALIGGTLFGLAGLLTRIPERMINLPNKEYWLSPPRRAESLGYVQRQIAWSAAGVLSFMVLTTQLVIRTNLAGEARLPVARIVLLLVMLIIWVSVVPWRVYRRFSVIQAR